MSKAEEYLKKQFGEDWEHLSLSAESVKKLLIDFAEINAHDNKSAPVDDVVDLWEENALLKKRVEELEALSKFNGSSPVECMIHSFPHGGGPCMICGASFGITNTEY